MPLNNQAGAALEPRFPAAMLHIAPVSGGGGSVSGKERVAAESRVVRFWFGSVLKKSRGYTSCVPVHRRKEIMTRYPLKARYTLLLSAALLAGGCTTYYQIQDPVTGDVYYADDIKTLDGGAVRFTDAQSGTEVTVQNSDIKEISEDEYNIRRYEPEAARGPSGESK